MSSNELPDEILLQIFRALCELERERHGIQPHSLPNQHQPFLSISPVSRRFHILANYFIFERITWNVGFRSSKPPSWASGKKMAQCLQVLDSKPHLAGLVQMLTVNFRNAHVIPRSELTPYIETVEQSIPRFVNLRSLYLHSFPIRAVVYQHISELPLLQSLTVDRCLMPLQDPTFHQVNISALRKLDSLIVRGPTRLIPNRPPRHLVLSQYAMAYIVGSRQLRGGADVLELESVKFLGKDRTVYGLMNEFLEHCPTLQTLRLTLPNRQTRHTLPTPVPQGTIPNLLSYRGTHLYAAALVPGRPLERLTIDSMQNGSHNLTVPEVQEALRPLSLGSSYLHHLTLMLHTWHLDILTTITQLFPKLETLTIYGQGITVNEGWPAATSSTLLSALVQLQVANFRIGVAANSWSYGGQRKIIESWGKACPLLREASILLYPIWERSTGGWRIARTGPYTSYRHDRIKS